MHVPTRVQERPSRWSAVGSRRSTPSSRRSPRRAAGVACPGDVTDLDQMKNAASAVVEAFGHIDLVVANAGAAPPMGGVLDADEVSWRAIVDLNLTGVWITAKATVPRLVAHGGGAFVTIGSGAARGTREAWARTPRPKQERAR